MLGKILYVFWKIMTSLCRRLTATKVVRWLMTIPTSYLLVSLWYQDRLNSVVPPVFWQLEDGCRRPSLFKMQISWLRRDDPRRWLELSRLSFGLSRSTTNNLSAQPLVRSLSCSIIKNFFLKLGFICNSSKIWFINIENARPNKNSCGVRCACSKCPWPSTRSNYVNSPNFEIGRFRVLNVASACNGTLSPIPECSTVWPA